MSNPFGRQSLIKEEPSNHPPRDLESEPDHKSAPIRELKPLRQCQDKGHNNRMNGMCKKVEPFRSQQQGSKQQAQMDRIRGGLCELENKYDLGLNPFSSNVSQKSEQPQFVKSYSHKGEESRRLVINRRQEQSQSAPNDLRRRDPPLKTIGEMDGDESPLPKTLKPLHPQKEESLKLPEEDKNDKVQKKKIFPLYKTEPFISPNKGNLSDSLFYEDSIVTNYTYNPEPIQGDNPNQRETFSLSLRTLNQTESIQSKTGSVEKQNTTSSEREEFEEVKECQMHIIQEMDSIKWQICSVQEEFKKVAQQNVDLKKHIKEDRLKIPPSNKHFELENRILGLEKKVTELQESVKEKENLSREEIRKLKEILEVTQEKVEKLKKTYASLEAEVKAVHEEQYRQNKVMGVDRRATVQEKYLNLSKLPSCYLEFCLVFYYQLCSLFTNSISLSFGSGGTMPSNKIIPKATKLCSNVFSLIPVAGSYLAAGTGVLEIIYEEIKESQDIPKAKNIRHILAKFSNYYIPDEVNLLAAIIACDITQKIGSELERLVKRLELLNSSFLQKLKQKISTNGFYPEMEIAIVAFECLLNALYEMDLMNFHAKTETEFKIECIDIVIKGNWYKKLGK